MEIECLHNLIFDDDREELQRTDIESVIGPCKWSKAALEIGTIKAISDTE